MPRHGYFQTELSNLIRDNDDNGLRKLCARGTNPNDPIDTSGMTALMHAVLHDRAELVRILLAAGADVNAQDRAGYTALHFAAQQHLPHLAELLLAHSAATEIEDSYGNTPLWRAVMNSRGRGAVIPLLLKAGANPHHPNKSGRSPIDAARSISNFDVMQFFKS